MSWDSLMASVRARMLSSSRSRRRGLRQRQSRPGFDALESRQLMTVGPQPFALSGWYDQHASALAVTTVVDSHRNFDVFIADTNHVVSYRSQSPAGTWSNWTSLGGGALSLSAIRDSSGNLDVFVIGTDNAVYYQSQSASTGAWSGWKGLGGGALSLSTALDSHGNLDVFVVGTNNAVYYQSQSASTGAWSGWKGLGGGALSLSTALDSHGDVFLAIVGTNNVVYYQLQSPSTGAWSDWIGLGGGALSLSAACDGNGNPALYIQGTNNGVYYQQYAPYSQVNGTLFGPSGPSYLDVRQGVLGDCWLLASLAEVAAREPSAIRSMFIDQGSQVVNGSVVHVYAVRFYNAIGVAQYVTVDTELPAGGGAFDRPVNGVLWVALAEKAYVEASAAGIVQSGRVGVNNYDVLNFGDPAWALQAITGQGVRSSSPIDLSSAFVTDPNSVIHAWVYGEFIVLGTTTPTSSYIAGQHDYALVGYNPSSSEPFELFNPWGTTTTPLGSASGNPPSYGFTSVPDSTKYGLFFANAAFLSQNFNYQDICASPGTPRGPVNMDVSIAPATLSQANRSDAVLANLGGPSQQNRMGTVYRNHLHADRNSDMLDLARAASITQLLEEDAVSALAGHLRRNATGGLFADSQSS